LLISLKTIWEEEFFRTKRLALRGRLESFVSRGWLFALPRVSLKQILGVLFFIVGSMSRSYAFGHQVLADHLAQALASAVQSSKTR